MITSVSFDQFVRLAQSLAAVRAAVRKLHDGRRQANPALLDVLRFADMQHTASGARACLTVAKAEVDLLTGLAAIVEAGLPPESKAALRARLLDVLREDMGDLRVYSDRELGSMIRALLTVHETGQLDTLDRMANQVANDIATTVAGR